MQEPVQDGRGNDGVTEDFTPLPKAPVAGKDNRPFFVAVGDKLE